MSQPKKETALRNKLKKLFKSMSNAGSSVHLTWVESHATSLGVPDLNYCVDGVEGWLELKAGPHIDIRASQVIWMKEHIASGGWPLFFISWGNMFLIVPGDRGVDLRQNPCLENVIRLSSSFWTGEIPMNDFLLRIKRPAKEYKKVMEVFD